MLKILRTQYSDVFLSFTKDAIQHMVISYTFHATIMTIFSIIHVRLQIKYSNLTPLHVIFLFGHALLFSYGTFLTLSMLFSKIYPFEHSKDTPKANAIPGIIRGPFMFVISCAFLVHPTLGSFLHNKMNLPQEASINRFQSIKELIKIVVSYFLTITITGIFIVLSHRFNTWITSPILKFLTPTQYYNLKNITFLSEWTNALSYMCYTLTAITATSIFEYITNLHEFLNQAISPVILTTASFRQ